MGKKKVAVGLSGGVDSSVTAFLLKEAGYEPIALFMKNWEEAGEDGVCKSAKDHEDALKIADHLKIPCYTLQFIEEYQESVFTYFLESYKKGFTPNPDILCNREIKFKAFFNKALQLGVDQVATGHYAQNLFIDGRPHLVKGNDPLKDQSYFLYTLQESILKNTLFPIGGYCKEEVRQIAKKAGLVTYDKKDSTGICFIGKRDFKPFLSQYLGFTKGYFTTLTGEIIGEHDGIAYYTIGQRKGLCIGGEGEAWYVVDKDLTRNVVVVAQGALHPALYADELIANDLTWINSPPELPLLCKAKCRYRQQDQECFIEKRDDSSIQVTFSTPQRAITLGQSVVFYQKEICLGGGIISQVGKSYYERGKELVLTHLSPEAAV